VTIYLPWWLMLFVPLVIGACAVAWFNRHPRRGDYDFSHAIIAFVGLVGVIAAYVGMVFGWLVSR
jgi:uncharacterized membrane protein AbrB (regulator of aidB expression)